MRTRGCAVVLTHTRLWPLVSDANVAGKRRHPWRTGINVSEQPGGRQTQDLGETKDGEHRNIALPQFDLADIRGPYARPDGEGPMGKPPLLSVLTEGCSKTL